MEPENNIDIKSMKIWFEDQEIGTIENASISIEVESPKEEIKDIPFELNKKYECSFKLIGDSKKRLFLWLNINSENIRLIKIFNKTKKLRTKKKLLGRINKNRYELIKNGIDGVII